MTESQNHPPKRHVDSEPTPGQFEWKRTSPLVVGAIAAILIAAAVLLGV